MTRKKSEEEEELQDIESEEDIDPKNIDENYSEEDMADESGEYIKGFNEELLTCDYCSKDIDPDQAIVREIDNEEHTFCSERCAANFKKEIRR